MTKFSKNLYIVGALMIIIGGFFILSRKSAEAPVEKNIPVVSDNQENKNTVEKDTAPAPASTRGDASSTRGGENILPEKNIPDKIIISVPFATQAPLANWDALHEEACEEASLIMLKYYLDDKRLTPSIAEEVIQRMVEFEIKNYGDYKDSTAEQIVKLAEDFYGIQNLKVIYDFPKEDLKKYLAEGNPMIVPAAGRELGNPNFTAPGPLYHNLVLIGYDKNTIITNDPGTRKGRGYTYDIDVLYNAIHDFPGKPEDITQGRKAMIVLENQ
jgi:hypothetical protein